jgi:hypothetical protein
MRICIVSLGLLLYLSTSLTQELKVQFLDDPFKLERIGRGGCPASTKEARSVNVFTGIYNDEYGLSFCAYVKWDGKHRPDSVFISFCQPVALPEWKYATCRDVTFITDHERNHIKETAWEGDKRKVRIGSDRNDEALGNYVLKNPEDRFVYLEWLDVKIGYNLMRKIAYAITFMGQVGNDEFCLDYEKRQDFRDFCDQLEGNK